MSQYFPCTPLRFQSLLLLLLLPSMHVPRHLIAPL